MDWIPREPIVVEYQRLEALMAVTGDGPGRVRTFGWNLEYTTPSAVLTFLDQILYRGLNDFTSENPRPVILDCGANIGYTVLHYKRLFPGARIVAFEPDPEFLPLLKRNLARNDAADVEVVEAAAWIADGSARWVMEGKDGSRLLADEGSGHRIVDVATVDLARYLDRDVDLLKIDIEGAEFTVVPHLATRLGRVKNILVELHINRQSDFEGLGPMLSLLREAGFVISLNSFGPWRDLTRRHDVLPLHAEQYMIVSGTRVEAASVSREHTYLPYVGVGYYRDLHHISTEHAKLLREHASQVIAHEQALTLQAAQTDALAATLSAVASGALEVREIAGPFHHDEGVSWIWQCPEDMPEGDSAGRIAPTLLFEDGKPLGPAHAMHSEIRGNGLGRFSHWGNVIFLSTSDNSDPNSNGRRYSLLIESQPRQARQLDREVAAIA